MPSTLSKYSDDEESTDGILHSEEQIRELDNTQDGAGEDEEEEIVVVPVKKFYQSYAPFKYFANKEDAIQGWKFF
jgi:hypothetical protein